MGTNINITWCSLRETVQDLSTLPFTFL